MHSVEGTSVKSFIGTVVHERDGNRGGPSESSEEVKAKKEREKEREKRETRTRKKKGRKRGGGRAEINKSDSAKEGEKIIMSIVRGPHVVRAVASRYAAFRAKRRASVRV